MLDLKALFAELSIMAGVKLGELPGIDHVVWFNVTGVGDSPIAAWRVGQVCPVNGDYSIAAIFADADEFRVYCQPIASENRRFKRYSLTRTNVSLTSSSMSMQVWKDEIAGELVDLSEESGLDNEREAIAEYLKERLSPIDENRKVIEEIEAGAHFEEDEEEGSEGESAPQEEPKAAVVVDSAVS